MIEAVSGVVGVNNNMSGSHHCIQSRLDTAWMALTRTSFVTILRGWWQCIASCFPLPKSLAMNCDSAPQPTLHAPKDVNIADRQKISVPLRAESMKNSNFTPKSPIFVRVQYPTNLCNYFTIEITMKSSRG